MCGMGTGSISGDMLQKNKQKTGGRGLVYIYSSGDPGAGGCRSRVDLTGVESLRISGRWRMAGGKVPTKCMSLGEMRNGLGLRQSAQDKNN